MKLTLWDSFSKRQNSTKRPDPAAGITYDVALKENCSISNPTFIMSPIPGTRMPNALNYALFEGRYYFVNNIILQSNHTYEIICTIDPLGTRRDSIANYTAFVERSASDFNVMIPDAAISQSDRLIASGDVIFNNESPGSTLPPFDGIGCFILRTVSGDGINGYAMSWQGVRNMMNFLFTDTTYPADLLQDSIVKSFFNPFQYILDLKWFPLSIDYFAHGSTVDIGWGWWASEDIKGYPLGAGAMGVSGEAQLNVPTSIYDDFRLFTNGFVSYNLYLPGVGVVSLSPDAFDGDHLRLECSIDYKTGAIDWNVVEVKGYGTENQEHLKVATFRGQVGIPQQIGQLTSDVLGNVMQGIGSALSIAGGNWLSGISGAYNTVQQSFTPQASINGSNGSMMQLTLWPYPTLSYKVYESAGVPQAVYGRPLYQNRRLGDLSGFVKCGGASLDIPGFPEEREAVNNYLNSGFYME